MAVILRRAVPWRNGPHVDAKVFEAGCVTKGFVDAHRPGVDKVDAPLAFHHLYDFSRKIH
jgi:hypothetical protein